MLYNYLFTYIFLIFAVFYPFSHAQTLNNSNNSYSAYYKGFESLPPDVQKYVNDLVKSIESNKFPIGNIVKYVQDYLNQLGTFFGNFNGK